MRGNHDMLLVPQGRTQVFWVQGERGRQEEDKLALQHLHQQGGQEGYHTFSIEVEEWQGCGPQGEQASQQGLGQTDLST